MTGEGRGNAPRAPHLAMSHCRKRAPRSMTACSDSTRGCSQTRSCCDGRGERERPPGAAPGHEPLQEARAALHDGVLGLDAVLLVDQVLPGLDVREVHAREVRLRHRDVPPLVAHRRACGSARGVPAFST